MNPIEAIRLESLLAELERELALKQEYAKRVELNVGTTSSIHEADYARGVVDGLRVAISCARAPIN